MSNTDTDHLRAHFDVHGAPECDYHVQLTIANTKVDRMTEKMSTFFAKATYAIQKQN